MKPPIAVSTVIPRAALRGAVVEELDELPDALVDEPSAALAPVACTEPGEPDEGLADDPNPNKIKFSPQIKVQK